MTTRTQNRHTRRSRRGPVPLLFLFLLVLIAVLGVLGSALVGTLPGRPASLPSVPRVLPVGRAADDDELGGRDIRDVDSKRPKVEASFARESYRPGSTARLTFISRARNVSLQFFRAGTEHHGVAANDVMPGSAVSAPRNLGNVWPRRAVCTQIGDWPTGVYFARLTARGGRIGYAPFVLRPSRLGEHRIAVVLPTQTWQAYNYRDQNGDHVGDTWYANWNIHTARLGRPFLERGVPIHYKYYDEPFLRWLTSTGKQVDYLSDAELKHVASGRELARRYVLIVFPGHHEYVTTHEYDVITGFRNRGGNLMFLSADNFFWQIRIHGNVMTRTHLWRDLGRPESGLIGVQYRANDNGSHQAPWVVRNSAAVPWLYKGTGLRDGSRFGVGGIEIDAPTTSSPPNTRVVAWIPNLFRRGVSGYMTYYETRRGAKVFAAGAFTFADCIAWPQVKQMGENLWAHMTSDRDTGGRAPGLGVAAL